MSDLAAKVQSWRDEIKREKLAGFGGKAFTSVALYDLERLLAWVDLRPEPIETIPNIGRSVLVWDSDKHAWSIMRADDWHANPKPYFVNDLTHWLPLPGAPNE
jgi:hypothetical protein